MSSSTAVVLTEPTPRLNTSLQPTVEHVEEDDADHAWQPSPEDASLNSSALSSRASTFATTDDEEDVEEVIRNTPALCRRDFAHEVATNLWGMVPPKNFGTVLPGLYRSSYPKVENLSFLKLLGLKSILTLVPGELPDEYKAFISDNGIASYQIPIEPNKNPFVTISACNMTAALGIVLNRENYPMLIHCNKGKHRTGCVVGCVRKVQGKDLAEIFAEYVGYAGAKARVLDERFIELFDERSLLWLARSNNLIDQGPLRESPLAHSAAANTTRLRG